MNRKEDIIRNNGDCELGFINNANRHSLCCSRHGVALSLNWILRSAFVNFIFK